MAADVTHLLDRYQNLLMAAKTIADGGNPALRHHD
jgi:hypothetical protein